VGCEGGYGKNTLEIADHINQLSGVGVVGINIEDSLVNNGRELRPMDDFAGIISELKKLIQEKSINIFVNVRTDPFLLDLSDPLEETLLRISAYEKAGADGIFIPGITNMDDIKAVISSTKLPVNVMCMPELPSFQRLSNLGVKRISMGNFMHDNVMNDLEKKINQIKKEQSFAILF
jgi:2-methylisocitrate lyase-like PEP mutase family enzyme